MAAVAGPPSPLKLAVPVPAIVVIIPEVLIFRTRWLNASPIYRLPEASSVIPYGVLSFAAVAGLQSPLKPAVPVPAIVDIIPEGSTLRITWLDNSAK